MEQSFYSTGTTTSNTTAATPRSDDDDDDNNNLCDSDSDNDDDDEIDDDVGEGEETVTSSTQLQRLQQPQHEHQQEQEQSVEAETEGDESEDFVPPPSSWYHDHQNDHQQQQQQQPQLQLQNNSNSNYNSESSSTPQHIQILLPAHTGTSVLEPGGGDATTPTTTTTTTSNGFAASSSTTRIFSSSSTPPRSVVSSSRATSSGGGGGGRGGHVVTYPSPSWKELSSQVLPAAARELLSSSLRRIYHTARVSYSRDVRWHRTYSDMGHNAGGFSITQSSNLNLPPNYHDRLINNNNNNNNNQHDDKRPPRQATQYIPPFSSLNWIDRQLVKEWRTYLPDISIPTADSGEELVGVRRTTTTTLKTTTVGRREENQTLNSNKQLDNKEEGGGLIQGSVYLDCKATDVDTDDDDNGDGSDDNDDHHHDHDYYEFGDSNGDPALFFPSVDEEDFDFEHARTIVPKPLPRPTWQKSDACWECMKPFGPTRLRHHCRFCGKSFCQTHSSSSQRLPHLGYHPDVPERVCDACHTILEEQNLAERVAWRLARCRDYDANQLTPYFETGYDSVEDVAIRVTRAAIDLAKKLPLGAQATVAVETVDVLRKYGLHGIYGIMLRQEFLAAADLLRKALGINKTSWPLSVHELSAAIFYALAQHRAMRGLNPERENIIHTLRPSSASAECMTTTLNNTRENRPSHVAAWTRTTTAPAETVTTLNSEDGNTKRSNETTGSTTPTDSFEKSALSFQEDNPILNQTDVYNNDYNADFTAIDSFQHEFTNNNRVERCTDQHSGPDQSRSHHLGGEGPVQPPKSLPTKFTPVCDPVPNPILSSLIFYAPIALNFIYAEKEVEIQLLAAQQGWRLLYASLRQDFETVKPSDMPASAIFIHEEYKIVCLSIRGTATINDVITDIRQTPVPFPDDIDMGIEQIQNDGDWTDIFHGQGLALCGMASAAANLFREHIDSVMFFAKKGYRIRLVGHSLGGGVATLMGILILKHLEKFPDTNACGIKSPLGINSPSKSHGENFEEATQQLRVYAYGTPSCVDAKLADSVNSFVTTVILHDDVFPRLTPTSCRGLLKHLLHIRETWVKAHMEEDLRAVSERAATAWAPRLRHSFTLGSSSSVKNYCKKKIQIGKKKIMNVASSPTKTGKGSVTSVRRENSDPKIFGSEDYVKQSDSNHGTQLLLEFLGGGESEQGGLMIDGDEFFEAEQSLIEDEDSFSEGSVNMGDSWTTDMHGSGDESSGREAGKTIAGNNDTPAVVLDENPLPRMFVPGKVVHIYSHRGVYKAAYVPRTFRELRKISMAGNMLSNHTTKAYFEGLLEVQTARAAPEAPPRWSAFDEDDTCSCCRNRFTWASTSNSQAQEARDKHNCRSCGGLVCDPCATNRVPIPSIGLTVPVRVCDRCYNDIMGGVSAASSSMTSSFFAVEDDDHTLSDTSQGRLGCEVIDDESGRPERRRQKRNMVVDDLVAQMKSSALTQRL